jgi:hypothetical protein
MTRKKKPKIGRPRLPKGEGKGAVVTVRLSDDERAKVGIAAAKCGQKLSEWVRATLLTAADTDKIVAAAESEAAGIEPHPR